MGKDAGRHMRISSRRGRCQSGTARVGPGLRETSVEWRRAAGGGVRARECVMTQIR